MIEEVAEAAAVIGTLQESRTLNAKPDLEWQRLESTFEAATSSAPPSQQYFTFLYYLFPCNTIRFLRGPTQYLIDKQVPSPYTVDWEEALDEDQIKSRSEVSLLHGQSWSVPDDTPLQSILRAHTVHPLLIWSDAQTELANDSHWVQYDVARIVGECTLLDVRNAGLAGRQRDTPLPTLPARRSRRSEEDLSTPRVYATELPPEGKNARASRPIPHPQLKLEDMVAHSFVLQSGGDVDVGGLTPDSARAVFSALPASPSTSDPRAAPQGPNMGGDDRISPHVQQALAKLQRDVLLLRNELNLELWLNRENVKHIGRLYEEKILSKNAEIERQALVRLILACVSNIRPNCAV